MTDPANTLGLDVWRRGAKLGLRITFVFFAVTAILYVIMGVLGWDGVIRALCAMAVGPIIGLAIIVGWWIVRRPSVGN